MKTILAVLLAALLAFVAWPYYRLFQLDDALGNDNLPALAELMDLEAIRQHTQQRFNAGVKGLSAGAPQGEVLNWLRGQIERLGETALEQVINLEWVMTTLRQAATRHSNRPTPYFLSAVDFAFFESPSSFLIRIGRIEDHPTHVRMSLKDYRWRVTDIIQ